MNQQECLREILGFDPNTGDPFYPRAQVTAADEEVQDLPDIEQCLKLSPFRKEIIVVNREEVDPVTGLWFVVEKHPQEQGHYIKRSYYQRMHFGNYISSFALIESLWVEEKDGLLKPDRIINKSGVVFLGEKGEETELWLSKTPNRSKFVFDSSGTLTSCSGPGSE